MTKQEETQVAVSAVILSHYPTLKKGRGGKELKVHKKNKELTLEENYRKLLFLLNKLKGNMITIDWRGPRTTQRPRT